MGIVYNSVQVTTGNCLLLATMQTIPFDDIVPGGEVRFTVIDGKQYLSVRDVIMCVCGVGNDDAGKIWRRLSPQRKDEIQTTAWLKFQFGGRGHSSQHVITFPGAVKLVMFLPGEKAKTSRGGEAPSWSLAPEFAARVAGDLREMARRVGGGHGHHHW